MTWELRDHTADVLLAMSGRDEADLAHHAAAAVRAVLVGGGPVEPREERLVEVAAMDEGERFFRFLRELFYLYDVDGFLPALSRPVADGWSVKGEVFDHRRHAPRYHVKAITRHHWIYERGPEGITVEAVLDL